MVRSMLKRQADKVLWNAEVTVGRLVSELVRPLLVKQNVSLLRRRPCLIPTES